VGQIPRSTERISSYSYTFYIKVVYICHIVIFGCFLGLVMALWMNAYGIFECREPGIVELMMMMMIE